MLLKLLNYLTDRVLIKISFKYFMFHKKLQKLQKKLQKLNNFNRLVININHDVGTTPTS